MDLPLAVMNKHSCHTSAARAVCVAANYVNRCSTSAQPLTEQSSAWRSLLTMNSWMGRLISRRYKLKFASERDNSPDGGTGGPSGEENDLLRPRQERRTRGSINHQSINLERRVFRHPCHSCASPPKEYNTSTTGYYSVILWPLLQVYDAGKGT